MLVQIIKSEKDSYWYAECIGEVFEVSDAKFETARAGYDNDYILEEDLGKNIWRHISKEDCKDY